MVYQGKRYIWYIKAKGTHGISRQKAYDISRQWSYGISSLNILMVYYGKRYSCYMKAKSPMVYQGKRSL